MSERRPIDLHPEAAKALQQAFVNAMQHMLVRREIDAFIDEWLTPVMPINYPFADQYFFEGCHHDPR